MRRVENTQQKAGGPVNYQFDFGLGSSFTKSNTSLKEQKQDPAQSGSYASWAQPQTPKTSPYNPSSGWSQYQSSLGNQTQSNGGRMGSSQVSGTYYSVTQPLGRGKPVSQSGGGAKPASGWLTSDASSKLGAAGIAGVGSSGSDDVFGDLLEGALGRSTPPISKLASSSTFSMANMGNSMPKFADKESQRQRTPPYPNSIPGLSPEPFADVSPVQPAKRTSFTKQTGTGVPVVADPFQDSFSFSNTTQSTSSSRQPAFGPDSSHDPFGLSDFSSSAPGNSRDVDPFEFSPALGQSRSSTANPLKAAAVGDPFDAIFGSSRPSVKNRMEDPLEALLSRNAPASARTPTSKAAVAQVQEDDWGAVGFGGGGSSFGKEATTTELEGLPPAPAGVTAASASERGSEFYKSGQFPDAIKWLSWALELLKGSPNGSLLKEVLIYRASCYKEIGEYRKAIADCTKGIAIDASDTHLIMQRAHLYESNEKYKLGVADLKLVLKLDPEHKMARLTLSRLEKLIGK